MGEAMIKISRDDNGCYVVHSDSRGEIVTESLETALAEIRDTLTANERLIAWFKRKPQDFIVSRISELPL